MSRLIPLPASLIGLRLDAALALHLGESRSVWQGRIKQGRVRLDGKKSRPSYILRGNEHVELIPEPDYEKPPARIPELPIVYEDEDLLVIDKPAGLLVHPVGSNPDATSVAAFARGHTTDTDALRPGIVHRLDKDTSGLLIIAKTMASKAYLQAAFKAHQVHKTYVALVTGRMPHAQATIKLPVGRTANPTQRGVSSSGKLAITKYEVLEEMNGYSLIKAEPQTGRTHQLRVHFASLGHPIAGDAVYGGKANLKISRQFLHAQALNFLGPHQQRIDVSTPLPQDLENALVSLRQV